MKRCVVCKRAVEDSSGFVNHASCPWCGGALREDPAGPSTTADAVQMLWSFDREAPYRGGSARSDILDLCPGLTSAARDVARAGEAGALAYLRPGGDPRAAAQALLASGWTPDEAGSLVDAYLSLWPDGGRAAREEEVRKRREAEERKRRAEKDHGSGKGGHDDSEEKVRARHAAICTLVIVATLASLFVFAYKRSESQLPPVDVPPSGSTEDSGLDVSAWEEESFEADDLEVPQLSLGFDQHETQQVSWGPSLGFKVGGRGFNVSDNSDYWLAALYLDDDHTYNYVYPKTDETDLYAPLSLGHVHIDSPRISLWNRDKRSDRTERSWKEEQRTKWGGEHFSHYDQRQLVSQDVSGQTLHVYVTKCQYHSEVGDEDDKEYTTHYDAVLETDNNLLVVEMYISNNVEQLGYIDGEALFRDFLDGLTLTGL